MTLKELILRFGFERLYSSDLIINTNQDYSIELFDQDDWQYELSEVKICPETERIIFNLKLIGEKENDENCEQEQIEGSRNIS